MSVDVRPVSTRRDLKEFIRLPYRLYAGDANWVAPLEIAFRKELDPERNPFFRHARADYFLAFRDGRPVGRIAAIVNDLHNRQQGDRAGFWGWFEAEEDPDVALVANVSGYSGVPWAKLARPHGAPSSTAKAAALLSSARGHPQ